jgi:hypothetical protein
MPDPFITPLIIGGVAGALSPTKTTVKWSEIDAWVKGKRSDLKTPRGRATITREKAANGQIIVTVTVFSLVNTFLSTKEVPLGSSKWTADRLEPALERRFNGNPSFKIKLISASGADETAG